MPSTNMPLSKPSLFVVPTQRDPYTRKGLVSNRIRSRVHYTFCTWPISCTKERYTTARSNDIYQLPACQENESAVIVSGTRIFLLKIYCGFVLHIRVVTTLGLF